MVLLKNRNKLLLLLLIQNVVVVLSASYYQKEYSGYLFTRPGFNDAERRTQDQAQYWCNQNGSQLLAITNSSIQNAAVAIINDAIRQQNQLSGNIIITDGKRTIDNWIWINLTSLSPLSIGGQDRDGLGFALSYGFLYTTSDGLSLFAAQPKDTNYYICEFAGQTSCVNGYQYGGQCFQSFNEYATWFEARNRCLMRGGDLATFEFITTDYGLNSLNGSWIKPLNKYWVGARRQWWKWQSINSDVTYSQWSDGHPAYYDNQQCLCLLPNNPVYDWKWIECSCSSAYQFVCIRASSSSSSGTGQATPTRTVYNTISASLSSPTSNQWRSTSNAVSVQSVSASSATTQYSSPNASSEQRSTSMKGTSNALAIGLGVGLGGGFLLFTVLVIVLILLSRKGYISLPRKRSTPNTPHPPQPLPDITVIYADIPKQHENEASNSTANQSDPKTTIEYASLDIINKKPNEEDDFDTTSLAITDSKTNTLAPPGSTNHSRADDTQQYGQVFKKT